MRSRKSVLATSLLSGAPASLREQLALREQKQEADHDIARLTLRLPQATRRELRDMAGSRKISVNELIAVLIDHGLVGEGRPSMAESAPWFAAYLQRKRPEQANIGSTEDFG